MIKNYRLLTVILLAFGLGREVYSQTLGEAVDATNLTWTSTGSAGIQWAGQTGTRFDSADAVQSGPITHLQQTWFETTVVGPGTVSFWWKVFSCQDEDYLKFYRITSGTTNLLDSISGDSDPAVINWSYRLFSVPAGTHTLRWSYEKDDKFNCNPDHGWVDQVIYTTNAPIPLETAVDACGVTFTTGGNSNPTYWSGQTNVTKDGLDAAESGAVYGSATSPQESWMETTVTGATNVSFWWKVSSSTNQALLEFYVGATKKATITGEVNWTSNFFAFTGTQTLRWRYVKSNTIAVGSDRGWVDKIILSPPNLAPTISSHPQPQSVVVGSNVTFAVTAGGTGPLAYQWRLNGVVIPGATTSAFVLNPVQSTDAGTYSVSVSNVCGLTISSNANLTLVYPPAISLQPTNLSVLAGGAATFYSDATGTAPFTYQWRHDGVAIAGASTTVLMLVNVQAGDAGYYSLVVSNAYGSATSSNAALNVLLPPTISLQPTNRTVVSGGAAAFHSAASGTPPFTYQWRHDGGDIPGATSNVLQLANIQAADSGLYSLVVSNAYGDATSSNAALNVVPPPTISLQPTNLIVVAGGAAAFYGDATGTPPFTYQWRRYGVDIAGATGTALLLANVQAGDAGDYSLVVSDAYSFATSSNAALTVVFPPVISLQPTNLSVVMSGAAAFHGDATGTPPLTYQWRHDGGDIAGATSNVLALVNVQAGGAGDYSLVVSNAYGDATSSNASLSVLFPPAIDLQPTNLTVVAGGTAVFQGGAIGTPPFTYQWRHDGGDIAGATTSVLALANVQAGDAGNYSLAASNAYGSSTSSNAALNVLLPPTISLQPTNLTVVAGGAVAFHGDATGTPPFNYQWRHDGGDIAGATSNVLALANVQAGDSGNYSLVVSNAYGDATSSSASLTVLFPPTINLQPTNLVVVAGGAASFYSGATGTPPFTYQWRHDGIAIAGATTTVQALANVQAGDAGNYSLVVSNAYGDATSSNASLSVLFPPTISLQPTNLVVVAGGAASFYSGATGTPPFTYQWRHDGGDIAGATTAVLALANVQAGDAGNYSLVVSNAYGNATSSNAALNVLFPPTLSLQPTNLTLVAGGAAGFYAAATGTPPFTYQWRHDGVAIAGATTTALALANVQAGDAGDYSLVVSNAYGNATSSNASLSVLFPPTINLQPTNLIVIAGSAVSFHGGATGTPPFTYQWRHDGGNIAGATTTVLALANIQAGDAGLYSLVVSNAYGGATSSNASLNVVFAPAITTQPANRTAVLGSSASFDVLASGTASLTYQWRYNGAPIGGATASAYALVDLQAGDAGTYSVVVTNDYGSMTSSNALLVLLPPPILAIQVAGTNIALSWPLDYSDFGLEAAPDIVTGGWTNISALAITNGASIMTTLPPGSAPLYYRLRQQ